MKLWAVVVCFFVCVFVLFVFFCFFSFNTLGEFDFFVFWGGVVCFRAVGLCFFCFFSGFVFSGFGVSEDDEGKKNRNDRSLSSPICLGCSVGAYQDICKTKNKKDTLIMLIVIVCWLDD